MRGHARRTVLKVVVRNLEAFVLRLEHDRVEGQSADVLLTVACDGPIARHLAERAPVSRSH